MRDRAPQLPNRFTTPIVVLGGLTLVTIPILMDWLNLPGAPTHLLNEHNYWQNPGFTPHHDHWQDHIHHADGFPEHAPEDDIIPDVDGRLKPDVQKAIQDAQHQIDAMKDTRDKAIQSGNAFQEKMAEEAIEAERNEIKIMREHNIVLRP